ncbi:expressed protein [Dictyostelium purpureum]|uniref:Expressed protein n=1 Tax=Dictyostelium purpureum TaxID=5786 RepID=F0ZZ90_DICPU|nr:uncharacterized protein DICPUDRAFT_92921 [Dictyostelium purpureum]EGC30751.1 expressed protein [Dictyostelium purpureum]|eukprot:XP_003292735.1 expressed protein [Dictyostelium purpureum]
MNGKSNSSVVKKKEIEIESNDKKIQKRKEKYLKKVSIDHVDDEEFRRLYYFDKRIVKTLYNKLIQVNKKLKEEYLLWALSYLLFKHSHEKKAMEYGVSRRTYQCRIWDVFNAIDSLKPITSFSDRKKTSIKNEFNSSEEESYISLILDVAFFPFSNREVQYVGKGGPGLIYEIGFSPIDGEILYLNGPHPAAFQNIMVFREGFLYDTDFEKGEMVLGTKSHRGEPDKIITPHLDPSNTEQELQNNWLKSKRQVSDKIMGIIKQFKISHTGWSSSIEKHQLAISFLLYAINLTIIRDRDPKLLDEINDRHSDISYQQHLQQQHHSQSHQPHHPLQVQPQSISLFQSHLFKSHLLHQPQYNDEENDHDDEEDTEYDEHNNNRLNKYIINNIKNKNNLKYINNLNNSNSTISTINNTNSYEDYDSDEETIENHSNSIFTKNNHLNKPMFFCISSRAHIEKV